MNREIDAKVAECLGWQWSEKRQFWRATDGKRYNKHHEPLLPFFSTTGDGMLLLIEEARNQGIYLDPSHYPEGWRVNPLKLDGDGIMSFLTTPVPVIMESLPLATALAFLKAKGVDITPYLKCGRCDGSGFIDHGEGPLGGAEPCGCGGNGE
jgi:hypothetical protein